MRTKHVIVEDYNPEWKNEFERIKNELLTVLSGKINSIEHVGSTSVEGVLAKPIIDIDIVIDQNFEEVRQSLESIGYIYEEDLGISGREAFKYPEDIDSYIKGKQSVILEIYRKCGLCEQIVI